jgi:hypothetical protein
VLQWAEGWSSVRFFHQTFLEFAAAYDLLCSDRTVIQGRIKLLLDDVTNFNFFRAPVLKQVAILSFDLDPALHLELMRSLRGINNELAAQLALEIVGKIPDSESALKICERWILEDQDTLKGVICETVRHYAKSKTGMALRLLEPYLGTNRETAIYALCMETFAKSEPEMVHRFLHPRLPFVVNADDDAKTYYKNALCAVAEYGASLALDDLLELLPKVKAGQQSAILHGVAEVITETNAPQVDRMIRSVIDLLPRVPGKSRNEVWDALCCVTAALYKVSPETAVAIAHWLLETEIWRRDISSALFVGRILGQTRADAAIVESAMGELRAADHLVRMLNTGLLAHAPAHLSQEIMGLVLNLDRTSFGGVDTVRSLFTVVGNLHDIEAGQVLRFLERWPWPASGIGTPLVLIIRRLAIADPLPAKLFLLEQLRRTESPLNVKIIRALTLLLQERPDIFERAELEEIYQTSFAAQKAGREVFAAAIGAIATVDTELAERIFTRLFDEEGKDCQVVAVNSLLYSLRAKPSFALGFGRRVLNTSLQQRNPGLLDNYLVTLKSTPREHSRDLLAHLGEWFTELVFENLQHAKILGELLALLKVASEADPELAFRISQRIPIINKGIAGGLAALYDNVSEHSDDPNLLGAVLEAVGKISSFNQVRIGNALSRTLPRLGQKLGSSRVIEMVMTVYKEIKSEQSLRALFKAALEIPGWGAEENEALLRDKELPGAVRSLLSTRARR